MEQLFIQIIQLLKEQLPSLSLVDEDYGQLEAGIEQDSYPVCVVISSKKSTNKCYTQC